MERQRSRARPRQRDARQGECLDVVTQQLGTSSTQTAFNGVSGDWQRLLTSRSLSHPPPQHAGSCHVDRCS